MEGSEKPSNNKIDSMSNSYTRGLGGSLGVFKSIQV